MPQKFTNNARALLQTGINASATTFAVEAGKADRFPVANTGNWTTPLDWFKATAIDTAGNLEIMYVGLRAGGSGSCQNVLRGQEGTTAISFAAGSIVMLSVTAQDVQNVLAGIFGYLSVGSAQPVLELVRSGSGAAAAAWYINSIGQVVLGQSNGSGGITADRVTINPVNGNITTGGTVTMADFGITSDERLKQDWLGLPADFLELLAGVKHGTYELVDGGGARLPGVSAQSLQQVMRELVGQDPDGMLNVRYAQAALVAAIQLAQRSVATERRLAALEARLA